MHKIKYKQVKRGKRRINYLIDPYRTQLADLNKEISYLNQRGVRVLYLDEAMFTFNTLSTRSWS